MSRPPNNKLPKVSSSDSALFQDAVSDVKCLPKSNSQPTNKIRSLRSTVLDRPLDIPDSSGGVVDQGGDRFYRPGVKKRVFKDLKRGRPAPDAEIDLHGCTRREALNYLQTFLEECSYQQANCVRVVTGKGRRSPRQHSVVRESALAWLRQQPQVLAYCTAQPDKGGSGAFYILLSR